MIVHDWLEGEAAANVIHAMMRYGFPLPTYEWVGWECYTSSGYMIRAYAKLTRSENGYTPGTAVVQTMDVDPWDENRKLIADPELGFFILDKRKLM